MADQSYLPDVAGGMVAAASFADDDAARAAVDLMHGSGVRWQDISVIARDHTRAAHIAGDLAWTPWKAEPSGVMARLLAWLPGGGLPREIRRRYGRDLAAGSIVVVAAAGGQPPDTLQALLERAHGEGVASWWTGPLAIFPPPELAGPF